MPLGTAWEKGLAKMGSLSVQSQHGRQTESQTVAQVEIRNILSETLQEDAPLAPSPQSSVSEITSCARARVLQVVLMLLFKCSFSLKENKVDLNKSPIFGKVSDALIDICNVKTLSSGFILSDLAFLAAGGAHITEDLATAVSLTLRGFSHFHRMGTTGVVSRAMKIQNKITHRQLLSTALFFNLLTLVNWHLPC